jgi:hypothetical protein
MGDDRIAVPTGHGTSHQNAVRAPAAIRIASRTVRMAGRVGGPAGGVNV